MNIFLVSVKLGDTIHAHIYTSSAANFNTAVNGVFSGTLKLWVCVCVCVSVCVCEYTRQLLAVRAV